MKSLSHGMTPQRGEIWWARFDPTLGSEINKTFPCVVISSTLINDRGRAVVVIPLSSSTRLAPPLTVRVKCAGRQVVAVIDQVRAIAKERLTKRIEDVSP